VLNYVSGLKISTFSRKLFSRVCLGQLMVIKRIWRLTKSADMRTSSPQRQHRIVVGAFCAVVGISLTSMTLIDTIGPSRGSTHYGEASIVTTLPAPVQLHQLDFLLGKIRCTFNTGTKVSATTQPILDGHYYQMDLTAENAFGTPKLTGRWVLGWSSIDTSFFSYYYDNAQIQGTATSAGWQNDHLVLTGTYKLGEYGKDGVIRDDFTRIGDNHFRIHESIKDDGKWHVLDVQDCYRYFGG